MVVRAVRNKPFWQIRLSSLKLIANTLLCRMLLILNQNRTWSLVFNCLFKKKKKPMLIWGEGRKDKNVPGNQFWNSIFWIRPLVKNVITLYFENCLRQSAESILVWLLKGKWSGYSHFLSICSLFILPTTAFSDFKWQRSSSVCHEIQMHVFFC